jgi:hypothetical protein
LDALIRMQPNADGRLALRAGGRGDKPSAEDEQGKANHVVTPAVSFRRSDSGANRSDLEEVRHLRRAGKGNWVDRPYACHNIFPARVFANAD